MTLDSISMIFQQPCLTDINGGKKSSGPELDTQPDDDDDEKDFKSSHAINFSCSIHITKCHDSFAG